MTKRAPFALLAVVCGCTVAQSPSANRNVDVPKAISVCELLASLPEYRGKIVTVKGVYWDGLREPCREPFATGDRTWAPALDLVDSKYPSAVGEAAPFETDGKSWDRLDRLALEEAKAGRREEIWVVIVGLIRAPGGSGGHGERIAGGYGHLGVFPAQLVVERILNVTVKDSPTYDYGELLQRRR